MKNIFLTISLWLCAISVYAQEVKGRLIDEEGMPYPNVKVFWKGHEDKTYCCTLTNEQGEFLLKVDKFLPKDTLYLHAKSPDPILDMVTVPYPKPITLNSIPEYITFEIRRIHFTPSIEQIEDSNKLKVIKEDSLIALTPSKNEINQIKINEGSDSNTSESTKKNSQSIDLIRKNAPLTKDSNQGFNPKIEINPNSIPNNPKTAFAILEDKIQTVDQKSEELGEAIDEVNELLKELKAQAESTNLNPTEAQKWKDKLNNTVSQFENIKVKYKGLEKSIEVVKGVQKQIGEVIISMYAYKAWWITTVVLFIITIAALIIVYRQKYKLRQKSDQLGKTLNENNQVIKERDQLIENKNSLIKEINHRVKNNLGLISSIIYLTISKIKHPDIPKTNDNIQLRIGHFAAIYTLLNANRAFNILPIEKYLGDLLQRLEEAYTSSKQITLIKNIEPKEINVNKGLIPLALIIHELVCNAYEHAFENKESGNIWVNLHHHNEAECKLEIKDDGQGICEGGSQSQKDDSSFGLSLVHDLAKQLKAEIKRDKDYKEGTYYSMIFPVIT